MPGCIFNPAGQMTLEKNSGNPRLEWFKTGDKNILPDFASSPKMSTFAKQSPENLLVTNYISHSQKARLA